MENGIKMLFCPTSIVNALKSFSQVPKSKIKMNAYKCKFTFNSDIFLFEFSICKNTVQEMIKRTMLQEQRTKICLRDCLDSFILGLDTGIKNMPQQEITSISEGLLNLIICYEYDLIVQETFIEIFKFLRNSGG